MTPFQILVRSLVLAIVVPSEEQSSKALAIAKSMAKILSEHEVARAKRDAREILSREDY